jgi:hypothetical protein
MASWSELTDEFQALPDDAARSAWIHRRCIASLADVATARKSNAIFYGSGFLQKIDVPAPILSVVHEDINGFMAAMHGLDCSRPLTLILHTPGGSANAAESIIGYLRNKVSELEVIVPTIAASAGTMMALGADRIVMGKQSQLGPIDPQFTNPMRSMSAQSVVDQFEMAKAEIAANPILAHAWAPILSSIGPALIQEAQNALTYGQRMVSNWLTQYMFRGDPNAAAKAAAVAKHFNDSNLHRSHGRRIDRDEAIKQGLTIESLEVDQSFQDSVLTAYHVATLLFEKSPCCKIIWNSSGAMWIKNWAPAMPPSLPHP